MSDLNESNPYATPEAPASPTISSATPSFETVGAGKRFLNYIIDIFGLYGFGIVVGVVIALLNLSESVMVSGFGGYVFGYLLMMIYYSLFEGVFGTSIGKLVTGCRVVGPDGLKVSFGKAVLRSLCRMIPFEQFSFLGSAARGWHDSITETYVVEGRS